MSLAARCLRILLAALAVAGCQTAGSLQPLTAAEVRDLPFVPPPRTVEGVLALLEDGPAPEWRARIAADRVLTASPDPGSFVARRDLALFYYQRGLAARHVGRARQQREDLARPVELGRESVGVNLASIISALGYAEEGGGRYSRHPILRQEALDSTRSLGAQLVWSMVLAAHHTAVGDVSAAQTALARAEHSRTSRGDSDLAWVRLDLAHYLYMRAAVARTRGFPSEAEGFARQAIAELDALSSVSRKEWTTIEDFEDAKRTRKRFAHLQLAQALAAQGRLQAAEAEARKAVGLAVVRYGRDSEDTASALIVLAEVVLLQGRSGDGERLAREAAAIFDRIEGAREALGRARARRLIAVVYALRGRWPEALAEFEGLAADMADDPETLDHFFRRDPDWALALTKVGRAKEAAQRLRPVVDRLKTQRPARDETLAELRGALGVALAASGEAGAALTELRAAVPVLLAPRPSDDEEGGAVPLRETRLRWVLEGYVGLLAAVKGTALDADGGAVVEAFRLADAARGRMVLRALGASAVRAAAKDAALAELVRQAQDARKQIGTLYVQLAQSTIAPKQDAEKPGTRPQQPTRPSPEVLAARVGKLERASEALADDIRRRFPGYAEVTDPAPATVEEARAALRSGEALVALYVGAERSYVWALRQQGPLAFAEIPLTTERVATTVGRLRRGLVPTPDSLSAPPPFDAEGAHALYAAVLGPVESGWQGATTLVIVSHGPLAQLPFELLLTEHASVGAPQEPRFAEFRGLPWLVRRAAVAYVPTVASLRILRALPPAAAGRRSFIGFGDPYFSAEQAASADREATRPPTLELGRRTAPPAATAQLADLPRLPETADEIRALAETLVADLGRDVYLGRRANERAVSQAELATYRVVAFATHGLVPGALDALTEPALALTAPAVAGVEGDGLLTMGEILGLRLDADWVVLSACDTASASGAGAEAVSGLGRAFFYAGTRAVLVSHWPVETTSARALTTALFQRQGSEPELGRAQALRAAMLALLDEGVYIDSRTGRPVFSYAHPMFWAPFVVVGDPGSPAR
jgi:CHAT domain-containing protein